MTSSSTGVFDPWRNYTQKQALNSNDKQETTQAPIEAVGVIGSTHPLDQDLVQHCEYALRPPGAVGAILVYGASQPQTAVRLFLLVCYRAPFIREYLEKEGFVFLDHQQKHLIKAGFVLASNPYCLSDPKAQTLTEGYNRLWSSLKQACGLHPYIEEALQTNGIFLLIH